MMIDDQERPRSPGGENDPEGTTSTERDPLEQLAAEFVERQRRGECPTIEEYVARCPEHADSIRELFPAVEAMERLKVRRERSSDGRVTLGGVHLDRLGDFRILREIGRGGMGIVYEAEQESLGRRVAVKVLPRQSLLHPRQLERFRREARTAAKLHHTNIVPVFGVGHQDGYHYYVMQYIHGVGLDRVLESLEGPSSGDPAGAARKLVDRTTPLPAGSPGVDPAASGTSLDSPTLPEAGRGSEVEAPGSESDTPPVDSPPTPQACPVRPERGYWQGIATIGLQAAEALAYAHAQGTLHRDIKPANLLLDRHGVVWVTDFGLAKAVEQDPLSETGDVVGTLRYMAPERFSGKVDARSDIYGLGLTLYELLVLRPAYEGTDRSRLLRSITQVEPVEPRKLEPRVPRDLETIILKAVARDPSHRYASAADLAVDLQRFLEDRPILARRTSAAQRVWRWARRNPATASLATTALSLLVLLAAVTTAGFFTMKSAMEGELRERKRAEATSTLALEALDKIFERFAPSRSAPVSDLTVEGEEGEEIELPVQPVLSKEAALLLEQLLVVYQGLAEQEGSGSLVPWKVAEANRRVGDIHQRLGQYEQAGAAYQRALEGFELIVAGGGGDRTGLAVQLARVHNELGNVHRAVEEPALSSHLEALEILESASSEDSRLPEHRYELARTYYLLARRPGEEFGATPPGASRPDTPRGNRWMGIRGGRGGRGAGPEGPGRRRGARAPSPQSERRPGRGPAGTRLARDYLASAVEILEALSEEHPSVPDYGHLLALCYREMPPRGSARGAGSEAPAHRATEILRQLVEDFPDVADYRYDLSEAYARVGPPVLPGETPDGESQESRLREALKISRELVAEHPNVPDYATSQARILMKLAGLLSQGERSDEAEALLGQALELQSSLAERYPGVTSYRVWTVAVREPLARTLEARGRHAEARLLLEASVRELEALLESGGRERHIQWMYVANVRALATVLRRMGEGGKADEVLGRLRTRRFGAR